MAGQLSNHGKISCYCLIYTCHALVESNYHTGCQYNQTRQLDHMDIRIHSLFITKLIHYYFSGVVGKTCADWKALCTVF